VWILLVKHIKLVVYSSFGFKKPIKPFDFSINIPKVVDLVFKISINVVVIRFGNELNDIGCF